MEKEKDLHKIVVKHLKAIQLRNDFIFYHNKNDVNGFKGKFRQDLPSQGVLPGVPDFTLLFPLKKVFFLEIKAFSGKLSDSQKNFLVKVNRFGYTGVVAFGYDDIVYKVNTLGSFKGCMAVIKGFTQESAKLSGRVRWYDPVFFDNLNCKKRKGYVSRFFY